MKRSVILVSAISTFFVFSTAAFKMGLLIQQTASPTIMPVSSAGSCERLVMLSCPVPGAKIYYTLDGSKPTPSSHEYSAPIRISEDTTVKAVTKSPGSFASPVASETFSFNAAEAGDLVSSFRAPGNVESLTFDGTHLITTLDGNLVRLDPQTGDIIDVKTFSSPLPGKVLIDGDLLYYYQDSTIFAIDPVSGNIVGHHPNLDKSRYGYYGVRDMHGIIDLLAMDNGKAAYVYCRGSLTQMSYSILVGQLFRPKDCCSIYGYTVYKGDEYNRHFYAADLHGSRLWLCCEDRKIYAADMQQKNRIREFRLNINAAVTFKSVATDGPYLWLLGDDNMIYKVRTDLDTPRQFKKSHTAYPGIPTNLSSSFSDGKLALTWSPGRDATGYRVYRYSGQALSAESELPDFCTDYTLVDTVTEPSCSIPDLVPGYYAFGIESLKGKTPGQPVTVFISAFAPFSQGDIKGSWKITDPYFGTIEAEYGSSGKRIKGEKAPASLVLAAGGTVTGSGDYNQGGIYHKKYSGTISPDKNTISGRTDVYSKFYGYVGETSWVAVRTSD